MTEQQQAQAALDALGYIVTAYCMSLGMNPPIPDEGSQTAEQVETIRTALKLLTDPDMVLVPRGLTEDMAVAFGDAWFTKVRCIDDFGEDWYTAMIEAYEQEKDNG